MTGRDTPSPGSVPHFLAEAGIPKESALVRAVRDIGALGAGPAPDASAELAQLMADGGRAPHGRRNKRRITFIGGALAVSMGVGMSGVAADTLHFPKGFGDAVESMTRFSARDSADRAAQSPARVAARGEAYAPAARAPRMSGGPGALASPAPAPESPVPASAGSISSAVKAPDVDRGGVTAAVSAAAEFAAAHSAQAASPGTDSGVDSGAGSGAASPGGVSVAATDGPPPAATQVTPGPSPAPAGLQGPSAEKPAVPTAPPSQRLRAPADANIPRPAEKTPAGKKEADQGKADDRTENRGDPKGNDGGGPAPSGGETTNGAAPPPPVREDLTWLHTHGEQPDDVLFLAAPVSVDADWLALSMADAVIDHEDPAPHGSLPEEGDPEVVYPLGLPEGGEPEVVYPEEGDPEVVDPLDAPAGPAVGRDVASEEAPAIGGRAPTDVEPLPGPTAPAEPVRQPPTHRPTSVGMFDSAH